MFTRRFIYQGFLCVLTMRMIYTFYFIESEEEFSLNFYNYYLPPIMAFIGNTCLYLMFEPP